MRAIFQRTTGVSYLFAGSLEHMMRDLFTMLIAQKSHLTTVELGTRTVDLTVVEQGLLGAMATDRIAHEQITERIRRSHKLGLVVAERLARGQPVYTGLSRGAVRRAVEALRDAGIIDSAGRGDWRFSNPLLRRYLHAMAPFE
jgi:DNA-binding transcriptional ArsR family regulator